MPDELREMLDAVRSANDSTTETPASETSSTPETTTETPVTPSTTNDDIKSTGEETKAEVVDMPQSLKEYLELHPDHKTLVSFIEGQFKTGLTPKLQRAADLEKQLEGIDMNSLQVLRELHELAETNPAKVAEYFRKQAEDFDKIVAEMTVEDPLADYVPPDDQTALLVNKIKEFDKWRVEQEKVIKHTAMNQEAQRINHELNQLEKKYGIEIPEMERAEAWKASQKSGLPVSQTWVALYQENLISHLLKKTRDEASSVVQTKQAASAGNPAPVAPRSDAPKTTPKDLRGFLLEAREELGIV